MRTASLALISALPLCLQDALAQTAAAPPAAPPSMGSSFLQMLFGLALVLGLLFAGVWFLKKLSGTVGPANAIARVVSATPVGTRERIVIVELGQTWLVLGVTPSSINTLAEMPRQPLPPGHVTPPHFGDWLRNAMNRRNAP
ncbi:MAG TPA: flagellar biosynthetic protein FliO [Rhodocyclaceae bacterium]|nr:flagellar biosynthetic protein FliO [Rhodocyclaceae bacterium]